jgi:hypothetical protein
VDLANLDGVARMLLPVHPATKRPVRWRTSSISLLRRRNLDPDLDESLVLIQSSKRTKRRSTTLLRLRHPRLVHVRERKPPTDRDLEVEALLPPPITKTRSLIMIRRMTSNRMLLTKINSLKAPIRRGVRQ